MLKLIFITTIIFFMVSTSLFGHQPDKLENQIKKLDQRISKLESLLENEKKSKHIPLESWRKIKVNMETEQVKKILGEPSRVVGGAQTAWSYHDEGLVLFFNEKVISWVEK